MHKILLVLTGGTIGSLSVNGSINTVSEQSYKIVELYKLARHPQDNVEFTIIQPLQLLSENLFPKIWETLIEAIEAEDIAQYSGIIMTHGTDTLAYTASALSLYFNQLKIPLLLVSSDHPLDHPLANGLTHFICAVEYIKQKQLPGVFVPYKNQNLTTLVHLGSRIASSLQLSGDFISVQSKAYLSFEENNFKQLNPINSMGSSKTKLDPNFSARILLIRPYPGLDYSHINLTNMDVVLHDLYHSGTACSQANQNENFSLIRFIKQCQQNNKQIYLAPAINSNDMYETSRSLIQQGAKMIWNMSLEAAYAKLLLAYGNFNETEAIDQFLEQNLANEMINQK